MSSPALLSVMFVVDFAKFFGVRQVAPVCGSDTSGDDGGFQRAIDLCLDLSLRNIWCDLDFARLSGRRRRSLFLCESAQLGGLLSDRFDNFGGTKLWLLPSYLKAAIDFPLRLDSELFSYKFKTRGEIVLEEWYAIKGGPLIHKFLGYWSPSTGMVVDSPNMWERRKDLGNAKLINGFVPLNFVNIFNMALDDGSHVGSMVDILQSLKSSLNFSMVDVPHKDFGVRDGNGDWNGVVKDLQQGALDISNAGLTHTPDRQTTIDFTFGVIEDKTTIVIRNPALYKNSKALDATSYLNIFPVSVWTLIMGQILVCSLLFCIQNSWATFKASNCLKQFAFGLNLCYCNFLQLGFSHLSVKLSSRILFLSNAMLSIVLFATYTGDLTAFMTAGETQSKIKSFEVCT